MRRVFGAILLGTHGANRIYNRQNFLTYTNPQTPRALQFEAVVRF